MVESAKLRLVVAVVVAFTVVTVAVVALTLVELTFPVVVIFPLPKEKLPEESVTGITLLPPLAEVFILSSKSTFKLVTLVVEVTVRGEVPIATVEVRVEAETELAVIDPVVDMEMSDFKSPPAIVPSAIEVELTLAVSIIPEVLTEKTELSLLLVILKGEADCEEAILRMV